MHPKAILSVLKEAFGDWKEDKASRLAAALSYYTAFSIAPLLLIAIAVAGVVLGPKAAQGQVFGQLEGLLGPEAAGAVEAAIGKSQQTGANTLSAIIGLVTLVWSASNVFAQLQDALNTIWEVQPKPGAGIIGTLKRRFLSMTMVLGIGFMLLVSLVLSAALAVLGQFFSSVLPGGEVIGQAVNFIISFGVITLLFGAIYKVLPDVEIAWSDVWVGAATTALLFTVGKLLIGLYLGHASVGSTYGAAGSLLVLLIWVYYSSQILFFGAEFTQVYARRYGSRIVPSEHAVALTEEARAQQGMPRPEAIENAAQAAGAGTSHESSRSAVATSVGPRNRSGNGQGADRLADQRTPTPAPATSAGQQDGGRHPGGQLSGQPGDHDRSHVVKTVLWSGLSAGALALTGVLMRRTSAALWQFLLHEPPPTNKV
jgi:membrane protein